MVGVQVRPAQDVELLCASRAGGGSNVATRSATRGPAPASSTSTSCCTATAPAPRWGANAAPGDSVEFQGPRGKLELRPAPWHLLVGDESALPAIAAICDALPPERTRRRRRRGRRRRRRAARRGRRGPLGAPRGARGRARRTCSPGPRRPSRCRPARPRLPDGRDAARWSRCAAVLEGRGVAHDAIFVKGYWNIGRPDRMAGRAPEGPRP